MLEKVNMRHGHLNLGPQKLIGFTADRVAKALYFTFRETPVVKTIEHVPDSINVDVDSEGKIVGVEFVGVTGFKFLDTTIFVELARIYKAPEVKDVPDILHKEFEMA